MLGGTVLVLEIEPEDWTGSLARDCELEGVLSGGGDGFIDALCTDMSWRTLCSKYIITIWS